MRVSFPVRQMLKLLSQSISKNIERLSYAQRLHTRKLVRLFFSLHPPSPYLISLFLDQYDDLRSPSGAHIGFIIIIVT